MSLAGSPLYLGPRPIVPHSDPGREQSMATFKIAGGL
jgi:hypothetical protein